MLGQATAIDIEPTVKAMAIANESKRIIQSSSGGDQGNLTLNDPFGNQLHPKGCKSSKETKERAKEENVKQQQQPTFPLSQFLLDDHEDHQHTRDDHHR